jgi:hypothetical protein
VQHGCDTRLVAVEDELRTMIDGRAGTWNVYARHLAHGSATRLDRGWGFSNPAAGRLTRRRSAVMYAYRSLAGMS